MASEPLIQCAALFVGKEGGYSFFSGVDASRAYLTGEFATDLNDNVTDFSNSQFAGLVHWKDFYLKVCTLLFCISKLRSGHLSNNYIARF